MLTLGSLRDLGFSPFPYLSDTCNVSEYGGRLTFVLAVTYTNPILTSAGGLLGVMSWILLAGAIVMMFFVILSGVTDHTPLNRTYFLRANTAGIGQARNVSQWTYLYVCGENNQDCGTAIAALPFGFAWYGNSSGVPSDLAGCVWISSPEEPR